MPNKTFFKNLNERPFNAIANGQKNIEIRANKNLFSENSVNLINEGDFIIFKKVDSNDKILQLIGPHFDPSVRQLFYPLITGGAVSTTVTKVEF